IKPPFADSLGAGLIGRSFSFSGPEKARILLSLGARRHPSAATLWGLSTRDFNDPMVRSDHHADPRNHLLAQRHVAEQGCPATTDLRRPESPRKCGGAPFAAAPHRRVLGDRCTA